jgi:hypothetical protein
MSFNVFTEQLLEEAYAQVMPSQPRDMQGNGVEVEEGIDFIPTQYESTDDIAKAIATNNGKKIVDLGNNRTKVLFNTIWDAVAFAYWAKANNLNPINKFNPISIGIEFTWIKKESANNTSLGGQQQLGYVQHLTPESKGS